MNAELVIRNGTIVDGTGAPGFVGDVEITDGIITAVGAVDARAAREIDADGLIVTPGFVDIHTHFDGQVTWDPIVAPSSLHGVTTIAMGNCGVGFAPAHVEKHDWLIGLLEGVEDIPGTALAEGLTWDWQTFPEYLDSLDAKPHTVDIGTHLPHAALRTYVMGERGADHTEAPSDDELARMADLVARGTCRRRDRVRDEPHRRPSHQGRHQHRNAHGERTRAAHHRRRDASIGHGRDPTHLRRVPDPGRRLREPRDGSHRGVRTDQHPPAELHGPTGVPLPRPVAASLLPRGRDARPTAST